MLNGKEGITDLTKGLFLGGQPPPLLLAGVGGLCSYSLTITLQKITSAIPGLVFFVLQCRGNTKKKARI